MRTGKVKQRQSEGDKQELQAEEEEGERERGEREGLGEWDAVCTCMPVRG